MHTPLINMDTQRVKEKCGYSDDNNSSQGSLARISTLLQPLVDINIQSVDISRSSGALNLYIADSKSYDALFVYITTVLQDIVYRVQFTVS